MRALIHPGGWTETYINIRGKWGYLFRAVDKHGKTVDFLLRPDRGIAAAQAFFRKALSTSLPRWPRKITLDGHLQSHMALRLLRREDSKWKYVEVRSNQYLNNLIEQDHRAIKRRCAAMVGGFKSFASAAITLAGIEFAHRIRKRQFSFGCRQLRNGPSDALSKEGCKRGNVEINARAVQGAKVARAVLYSYDSPRISTGR